jgi:hypothetical protein
MKGIQFTEATFLGLSSISAMFLFSHTTTHYFGRRANMIKLEDEMIEASAEKDSIKRDLQGLSLKQKCHVLGSEIENIRYRYYTALNICCNRFEDSFEELLPFWAGSFLCLIFVHPQPAIRFGMAWTSLY